MEVTLIDRPTLVAVVHPDITPRKDWENLSILEYRTSSAYFWEVDSFLKENGYRPTSMGELDDAFLMLESAVRGGFVAFVPRNVARDTLRAGRVKLLATLMPTASGVYAVYHGSDTVQIARAAVEKLIETARENIDRETIPGSSAS
jgi:DNA-binding transcriptional LysR family regulator